MDDTPIVTMDDLLAEQGGVAGSLFQLFARINGELRCFGDFDRTFLWSHSMTTADVEGSYMLYLKVMHKEMCRDKPREAWVAVGMRLIIHAHDDIRDHLLMVSTEGDVDEKMDRWHRTDLKASALLSHEAHYLVGARLVAESLQLMASKNKFLRKEQREVVQFFTAATDAELNSTGIFPSIIPQPKPWALQGLWLLFLRTENFYNTFGDMETKDIDTATSHLTMPAKREKHRRTLKTLAEDPYVRAKVIAILKHQALWYAIKEDHDAAFLFINEARALERTLDSDDDEKKIEHRLRHNFETSVWVQLMLNRIWSDDHVFRDCPLVKTLPRPHFINEPGKVTKGCLEMMQYYQRLYHSQLDADKGQLPDRFVIDNHLAPPCSGDDLLLWSPTTSVTTSLFTTLRGKDSLCAACGVPAKPERGSTSDHNGTKKHRALLCGQCKRVAYCSKACQVWHWRHGGHKAQCRTPDPFGPSDLDNNYFFK